MKKATKKDSDYYQPTKVKDVDIDNILNYVDSCIRRGEWDVLSDVFYNLTPQAEIMPLDIIVSYLVASLPGKSKIRYRQAFLTKCKELHPNEDWSNL
jgi:hypothetical protein